MVYSLLVLGVLVVEKKKWTLLWFMLMSPIKESRA